MLDPSITVEATGTFRSGNFSEETKVKSGIEFWEFRSRLLMLRGGLLGLWIVKVTVSLRSGERFALLVNAREDWHESTGLITLLNTQPRTRPRTSDTMENR